MGNQVIFHRKKKKQALLNILLIIFVMSVAGCNSAEVVKNNELSLIQETLYVMRTAQ